MFNSRLKMQDKKRMSWLWFKDNVDDYYKCGFKPYGKFRAILDIPIGRENQHKLLVHIEEKYGMIPIAYLWGYYIIQKKSATKHNSS